MKKFFLITAILLIACSSVVNAQQQEPSLKPTVSPKNAEQPPRLLLEVVFNPELPPSFSTVGGPEEKAKWIWFTRFVRLPGAEAQPAIRAVKVESKFNGESADVRVTLLRGSFDQEDLVGVYHVGVGEQKTLNDLRAVGVGPFSIKLLNTVPPLPPPPAFENHTKSIEIINVQAENMPIPAYRVTFRNLSDKHVLALRVDVNKNDRPGTSSFLRQEDGRPAIEAGGTLERYFAVQTTERTPTGYAPGTASANTIIIRTAVFADMSFEGESESACLFESATLADRVWLRTALALFDEELTKSTNEDQIEAARQFKERFAALRYEFTESERNQASAISPVCPKPIGVAQTSTGVMKLQVLRELDQIIETRPAPPVNFRAWLETHRVYYKAWLARL